MKSSDLFSHLDETKPISNEGSSDEPVQNPVFSDRPQRDSSAEKPSS